MTFRIVIFLSFALCTVIDGKSTRVIGGENAEQINFPYLASLKLISNDQHYCGGAIISARHVLTLGTCVDGILVNTNDLEIRVGRTGIVNHNEYLSGYIYKIKHIHLHPQYNRILNVNGAKENNIAVIKAQTYFQFNVFTNKILLPTINVRTGQVGKLVGWGKYLHPVDTSPSQIRKAWMITVDKDICSMQHNTRIRSDQFCGFQRVGVGACFGDNGSPFIINKKLIGLVSFFNPCGTGIPDVYVNVYAHLDFINSIINLRTNQQN